PAAKEGPADDLLGLAGAVRVGGVDEIDPRLEGQVDHPGALVGVGITPRAEHHAPETVGAEAQSGPAQRAVFHGRQTIAYDVDCMRPCPAALVLGARRRELRIRRDDRILLAFRHRTRLPPTGSGAN